MGSDAYYREAPGSTATSPHVSGSGVTMHLLPIVSWPKQMTAGERHLVAVNLALVTPDREPAPWPLQEEECVYTCALDGGADFDLWAVDDAAVVVHRFGGSYGPAEFVVTPKDKPGEHRIWLTIINQWGVPIGEHELPIMVRAAEDNAQPATRDGTTSAGDELGEQSGQAEPGPPPREEDVPVGLSALAEDLTAADEATVDIPLRELPDIREGPPADRSAPTARTIPDLTVPDIPDQDEDRRRTRDLVPPTRRDPEAAPYGESSAPRQRERASLFRTGRLTEHYNVAGLRRSSSGRLFAGMVPLFPPGAARGSEVTFTVCCSPSDERGTVFAVVAAPGDGSDRRPEPRSIQSAKIPPGMYRVTAELLYPGPGHVRFHGLPAPPREDPRPWPEIIGTVPRRLPPGGGPAHLIISIEISAPSHAAFRERIECADRLIRYVAEEARDFVCYSVISYGPHSIHSGISEYTEVPATTLVWAVTADDALAELVRLARRGPALLGYEHAAQLECVLTDLEETLTGQEGRPVIVTVGARPPHPARVDPLTGIIPCRRRRAWAVPMAELRSEHAGITFGSIRESEAPDELWQLLGADASSVGAFLPPSFAQALGLTSDAAQPSAPPIALPMFTG
jgi:hypothetical protein